MIAIADNQTRICPDCQSILPLDAFRFRKQGTNLRQGICRRCYNARMTAYRRARRSKTIRRFAADLREERDWRKVTALCAGMFRRFGGVEGFARAWAAEIHNARRCASSVKRILDSLSAIMRMAEVCFSRPTGPNVSDMSDEELNAEIDRFLIGRLSDLGVLD